MDKSKIAYYLGFRLSTLENLTWDIRLLLLRLRNKICLSRRKALRKFGSMSNAWLHFGCGPRIIPGWLNIDAYPYPGLDAELDLRFPIPLSDGSCRFIYAEHILEHFDADDGANICREFFRLLRQKGVARIVVPDAEKYWRAYSTCDLEWLKRANHICDLPLAGVNEIYYGHFHKYMYDFDLLRSILYKAGFLSVIRSEYRASEYQELNLDREETFRCTQSLYVEAIKS